MNTEITSKVVDEVLRTLIGWPGARGRSLRTVGGLVAEFGGDGNHVEIGSLFGASALVACMIKIELKSPGTVYCIDPMIFDEHEYCVRIDGNESQKILLRHHHQIFIDNTRWAGSRINLIKKRSYPWPLSKDQRFSTAFVDGWHYDDGPMNDVKTLVDVVDNAILLDDVTENYPDIYRAFLYMCSHPDWFLGHKDQGTAMFYRRKRPTKIFTVEGLKVINGDAETKPD